MRPEGGWVSLRSTHPTNSHAKPAAQEVADILGTAVGNGVADIVRQAVIDPELDIAEPAERLVIGDAADRLAAGNDDEGRSPDARDLLAPIVACHQQYEFGDMGSLVIARIVE